MSVFLNLLRNRSSCRLMVLALIFLAGCRDSDGPVPVANQYLVEAQPMGELGQDELRELAGKVSPFLGGLVQNGVSLYRITYRTVDVDGSEIHASGAMAIPLDNREHPMLSIQHGTIMDEASAPSNFTPGNEFMSYGSIFGALGYIAVFPDYIGYGASKHLPHPYEHRESLGTASLDMLRAVKEFFENEQQGKWNNKLYISGFSEGGYATLSLQKMLEEDAKGEFDLRASTCGAGAYNKTEFMKYLVNNQTHGNASYNRSYLWVLLTYNRIYGLNYPVSHFFVEPYASMIGQDQHLAVLNVSFNKALQAGFIQGINDRGEQDFIDAIADNDLLDWAPVTPTQLYHGTADELVFYFNSQTAFESMKAKGASRLELVTLEGKNHSTAVMDYLIGSYAFFSANP